jgi:glycine/D-amino acid oxidase-like deaminating enzyme
MDKPKLEPFLSSQLVKNANPYIDAPHGFGEVLQAGRLDTETLITAYKAFLKDSNGIIEAPFDYNALQINSDFLQYDNLRATKIVFADGFGVKNNPYFSYIPLNGTKGEVLTIKAPKLKIDFAIKSSVFVIPISDDLYTVGSTYAWDDKTNNSTEKARLELESKLKSFITCKYEVVNHLAGIRPTVNDRRPLIGQHPSYNNLFVLNGLGTRGVMIAPYVAKQLFEFIEKKHPLDKEISINRFVS